MRLSNGQKKVVKSIFKHGDKVINEECHIYFLTKCKESNVIPLNVKLKNTLPGNKNQNQEKLDQISLESIIDEKQRHVNILKAAKSAFEKSKSSLKEHFTPEEEEVEINRLNKHLESVCRSNINGKDKKIQQLLEKPDCTDVTLVHDDDAQTKAHKSTQTKRRRFKRRYLQPQPKKRRRRKRNELSEQPLEQNIHQGWNGVIKNISGEAVTKAEENLFSRGKKFCPIQLDPPVVRIQKELDIFFRNLRIQWIFQNQPERRSEL